MSPNRSSFKTKEDYNAYMREYRAKHRTKINVYKKEWARKHRHKPKAAKDKRPLWTCEHCGAEFRQHFSTRFFKAKICPICSRG